MGVELSGKTLGLIGCGNIGSIVANRAIGLHMKVVAYDPFLSEKRALDLGVEKLELPDLLARADFISLHAPLTEATRNILSREAIAQTKRGVRIINCARGGLLDEAALADALKSGHVAGAALDVFETEPAVELAALRVRTGRVHAASGRGDGRSAGKRRPPGRRADQRLPAHRRGDERGEHAVVTAEEAPRLMPYMALCRNLGAFAGQLTHAREGMLRRVIIEFEGHAAELNHRPLTAAVLAGLLTPMMEGVNMVNAPVAARERGIDVSETVHDRPSEYQTLVRVTVETDKLTRSVSGTLFAGARPRIVEIKGIRVEADFAPHMLYVTNQDKPGFIGRFGATLAGAGINIATFHLGRAEPGGDAICLVAVDEGVPEDVLSMVRHAAAGGPGDRLALLTTCSARG